MSAAQKVLILTGFQKECLQDKIRAHAGVSRQTTTDQTRSLPSIATALAPFSMLMKLLRVAYPFLIGFDFF